MARRDLQFATGRLVLDDKVKLDEVQHLVHHGLDSIVADLAAVERTLEQLQDADTLSASSTRGATPRGTTPRATTPRGAITRGATPRLTKLPETALMPRPPPAADPALSPRAAARSRIVKGRTTAMVIPIAYGDSKAMVDRASWDMSQMHPRPRPDDRTWATPPRGIEGRPSPQIRNHPIADVSPPPPNGRATTAPMQTSPTVRSISQAMEGEAAAATLQDAAAHATQTQVMAFVQRLTEELYVHNVITLLRQGIVQAVGDASIVVRAFLYDPQRRELVHHAFSSDGEIELEVRVPESRGVLGAALRRGSALLLPRASEHPAFDAHVDLPPSGPSADGARMAQVYESLYARQEEEEQTRKKGGGAAASSSRVSTPRDGGREVRPWSREQGGAGAGRRATPYPPASPPASPPNQASRAGAGVDAETALAVGAAKAAEESRRARAHAAAEAALLAITEAQKAERSMRAEALSLLVTPLLGGTGVAVGVLHVAGFTRAGSAGSCPFKPEHAALIEGIARPLAGMVRGALERTLQLRHVRVLDTLLHAQHMLASDSAKLKRSALKQLAQVFRCERAEVWLGDTFTYGFPDALTRPPWGFYATPAPADLSLVATAAAARGAAEAAALAAAPTRLGLSEATRRAVDAAAARAAEASAAADAELERAAGESEAAQQREATESAEVTIEVDDTSMLGAVAHRRTHLNLSTVEQCLNYRASRPYDADKNLGVARSVLVLPMEVAGRLVGVIQLTNKTGVSHDEDGDGKGASGAGAIAAAKAADAARAEALSSGATHDEAERAALKVIKEFRDAAVEHGDDHEGDMEAGMCTLEGGGGVFSAADEAWVARFARMAACVLQPIVVSRGATDNDAAAAMAAAAPAAPSPATVTQGADAARRRLGEVGVQLPSDAPVWQQLLALDGQLTRGSAPTRVYVKPRKGYGDPTSPVSRRSLEHGWDLQKKRAVF